MRWSQVLNPKTAAAALLTRFGAALVLVLFAFVVPSFTSMSFGDRRLTAAHMSRYRGASARHPPVSVAMKKSPLVARCRSPFLAR